MSETIKIVLLGDNFTGKTCIITKYLNNYFSENLSGTTGTSYGGKELIINDKQIFLNIWDSSGGRNFRALTKFILKDANIVILLYDITDRKSFEDIKILWYPDLKNYGEKYKLMSIVGNKSDLYEQKDVEDNEGKEYAKEINALFHLVSAKTGNNINLLFENLSRVYLGFPPLEEKKRKINIDVL